MRSRQQGFSLNSIPPALNARGSALHLDCSPRHENLADFACTSTTHRHHHLVANTAELQDAMSLAGVRQHTMLYPIASNADASSSSSSSPPAMRREGTGIHGNTRVDGMDVDLDLDKATPQHQGQRQGQDHQDAPSAKKRKLSSNGQPSILPQQQPKTRPPALPPTDLQAVDTLTSKQRSHLIRGARAPYSP